MLEAHRAGHGHRPAPVFQGFGGKFSDVNGVSSQRDIRGNVTVVGAEIGESRESIGERDLTEQLGLFDTSANIHVGHDRAARVDQSRHECANEPQVDAVRPDVSFDRVAIQSHVLHDELGLAAVLQQERVEREKPLRELNARGILQAVAIRGIHLHCR